MMECSQTPNCYAEMFPDPLHLPEGESASGKVMSVEIQKSGGLIVSGRRIAVNLEQWNACRQCPHFEDCYRLSLAKLTLAAAIR